MNPKKSHNRPGLWKGLLESHIRFSHRHRFLIVALSLVGSVLCGFYASHLKIDANLDALLPRDTETIHAMREAKARMGSSDLYTISIVMDDPAELARLQDRLADSLRKWPDVVYAQVARDNSFFRKHALLYLPQVQLEKISQKIVDLRTDLGKQGPLTVDLFEDDPQPASGSSPAAKQREWFDADLPQQLGLPDEAAESFTRFLKKGKAGEDKYDPKSGIPDSLRSRLMGRTREGQLVGLVQASLSKPSSDFDYVKTVVARSEALLAPVRAEYGARLQTGVEGPYKELAEVESLSSNGLLATLISVGLNILIIAVFFRGLGSVAVIFLQAVIACVVTLALTMGMYGHLNLYTAFVVSILFGAGIDFSIYVLGYALRLVRKGVDWPTALIQTLDELFYSLVVAASTTVAGLLTLLASKFVGFYEFGVQASAGIAVSLVGVYLLMPAYIFATESAGKIPGLGWLRIKPAKPLRWPFAWKPDWPKVVRRTALFVGAGAVVLAFFIPRLAFEYDFSKLRDTRGEKDKGLPVSVALGSNRTSSQPVVVMAKDSASMAALQDTLLQRLTVNRDPYLRSFLTLSTFVPPAKAQTERLLEINHIGELISARVFDRAKGDDSAMIANLRELTKTAPFTPTDIPAWSLNLLRERDGSYGRLGFIYGRYNSSNALDAAVFQNHYGHLSAGGEKLSSFSSSFVFSDIIRIVKSDSLRVAIWMGIVLVILLASIFRDWRLLTACFIQMVVGLVWILGLMGLFGLKIGPFNLIVITTLQGYAVDVASYMLLGYLRLGRHRIGELYSGIGVLVAVSTLTTTAGYAGMLFTTHMGIASIGKFAVLGLLVLLGTSMCLTPWMAMKLLPEPKESETDPLKAKERATA